MKDIPEKLANVEVELTGSLIRRLLREHYEPILDEVAKTSRYCRKSKAKANVVLIHGYSKHSQSSEMLQIEAQLQRRNCNVLKVDLPYHGLSAEEKERGLMRYFFPLMQVVHAIILKALDQKREEPIPVVVVANSTGALALYRCLQKNPYAKIQKYIACVVLVSMPLRLDHNLSRVLEKYKKHAAFVHKHQRLLEPVLEVVSRLWPDVPVGELPEGDKSDPLEYHQKIQLRTAAVLHGACKKARRDSAKISLPVLFVHGDADDTAPYEDVREAFGAVSTPPEHKKMITYQSAGHRILREAQTVNDIILWIEERCKEKTWKSVESRGLVDDVVKTSVLGYLFVRQLLRTPWNLCLRTWKKINVWK